MIVTEGIALGKRGLGFFLIGSFLLGGLVFYRKHTARPNDSTAPCFCHVFYSIFILGQVLHKRKSGKADLECTVK